MIKKWVLSHRTQLRINDSKEGEHIETKIDRIVNNNEPISDGAPIIYTERKQGVLPETDIRTDRFEIAIEAADKISKSYKARRENKAEIPKQEEKKEPPKSDSKGEETGG